MLQSLTAGGTTGFVPLMLTLCLTAILVAIGVIDLRSLRIPDALTLPLIVAGLVLSLLLPGWQSANHLIGAGAGFLLLAMIGEVYFRKRGIEGLGLGDAKLFAAAGAWLGWQGLPQVLLIAAVGGIVQALVLNGGRRDVPQAFGPWLALGFWLVWVWRL